MLETASTPADLDLWGELYRSYESAVNLISGGKRVADNSYLHVELLREQDNGLQSIASLAAAAADLKDFDYNVVRFSRGRAEIALLSYPNFFDEPFPALRVSWLVDVPNRRVQRSSFEAQDNPPILHRKELLLPDDHPRRRAYEELTRSLEDFGLFDRPGHLIGRRKSWDEVLSDHGIRLEGDVATTSREEATLNIVRHRTAISRSRLSAPMQALARWGLIDGATVFDYGCGRGDDLRALQQSGFEARGWDPHFAAEEERISADVVNLGFVLNVIEDPIERREALASAFKLAQKVLAVAVMLRGRGTGEAAGDGVVTNRGTFQKYYAQVEISDYIHRTLGRDPIAVAPGVFFVFRRDEDEQAFLAQRQRSVARSRDFLDSIFPPRAPREGKVGRTPRPPKPSFYETHREVLDAFWDAYLGLGRFPEPDEFDYAPLTEAVGRPKRALAALPFPDKEEQIAAAAERRRNDLLVYLGHNLFDRRRSFSSLPIGVQRDIRAFFRNHSAALDEARQILFAAGSEEMLLAAIEAALADKLGVQAGDGDYTFYRGMLQHQPALVRLMVVCAERLEPIPDKADLLKIHPSTAQVSYLQFDGFMQDPLPGLAHRTKIDLRRQKVWEQSPEDTADARVLFGKSKFVGTDFPRYDTQARFDVRLAEMGIYLTDGVGTTRRMLATRLSEYGVRLVGYRILKSEPGPITSEL